ncbi:MAG: DUF2953 domain-containing protein [Clostridia bacterium]|nr:DUF2953 domain-containing protein [Clostridia bacterium]
MIILVIIGIMLLLIAALLFLRIKFDIILKDEILIRLNVLGIKLQLYPAKEKKVSSKKFKKGYPSEKDKKDEEKSKNKKERSDDSPKNPLTEKINVLTSLLKSFFAKLFKHLRLDVSKILVTVGGKDAAVCAISYGVISQSVAYLLEFLDSNLKIHKKRRGEINVLCDFTSEETKCDIFISASLNIWQILDIGISLVYNYFNGKDIFKIKKLLLGGQDHNGRKQDQ